MGRDWTLNAFGRWISQHFLRIQPGVCGRSEVGHPTFVLCPQKDGVVSAEMGKTLAAACGGEGWALKHSAEEKVKVRFVLDTPVSCQGGQVSLGTLRRNVWAGDTDVGVTLRQ